MATIHVPVTRLNTIAITVYWHPILRKPAHRKSVRPSVGTAKRNCIHLRIDTIEQNVPFAVKVRTKCCMVICISKSFASESIKMQT